MVGLHPLTDMPHGVDKNNKQLVDAVALHSRNTLCLQILGRIKASSLWVLLQADSKGKITAYTTYTENKLIKETHNTALMLANVRSVIRPHKSI